MEILGKNTNFVNDLISQTENTVERITTKHDQKIKQTNKQTRNGGQSQGNTQTLRRKRR